MKKIHHTAFASLAIAGALIAGFAAPAAAQKFPDRSIRMVVPYAPGGATDIVARQLAVKLGEVLGQQVLIENKPGANANLGGDFVAKSVPDGYTLLMGDLTLAVNPGLLKSMPFDPIKDLTPIGPVAHAPLALVVHPGVQAANLREFIELVRRNPGKLTYGSAGNGNPTQLAAEVMKSAASLDILQVTYKGAGPAVTDLTGGQISMMIAGVSSVHTFVSSGRLRALAVTGQKRSATLPNVPTFQEAGLPLPEMNLGSWWGVFGPAGMPKDIVARLNGAINTVLGLAVVKEQMQALSIEAEPGDADTLTERMKAETTKWGRVIRSANITPQ
jgi:tripartite-type tricarboxylate transporter receptor subunit TctC